MRYHTTAFDKLISGCRASITQQSFSVTSGGRCPLFPQLLLATLISKQVRYNTRAPANAAKLSLKLKAAWETHPLSSPFHPLPLEVGPLKSSYYYGHLGHRCEPPSSSSPLAGSRAEPQPKSNLVHFSRKYDIWWQQL